MKMIPVSSLRRWPARFGVLWALVFLLFFLQRRLLLSTSDEPRRVSLIPQQPLPCLTAGDQLRCAQDIDDLDLNGMRDLSKVRVEPAQRNDAKASGMWFKGPGCSVLEFLAGPDPTVRDAYNQSLVCGRQPRDKDIVCSIFSSQVKLNDGGICQRQTDDRTVPRIVYFVVFGNYTFTFLHYVSVMAARRFIGPSALYVIGDVHPVGYWWQRIVSDCEGIRFVYRPRPALINQQRVIFPHHFSDIVRLQILLLNGGIYLDLDMVMTRDPEPLLAHDVTLGLVENVTGLGNAFIAARRNSDFVREWYSHYNHFNSSPSHYFDNSLKMPWKMWVRNPERVHVERERLYGPNYFEADKLFKRWDYDWSQNYAVHVWTNGHVVPGSEEEVQTANTTVAQVFRNALYGHPRPRTL